MKPFLIPDDFRSFMKSVVVYLETPNDELVLDSEDALDSECGYGGRIDGVDTYRFKYITADGVSRWDVVLKEAQIRDIADGLLIEVEAEPFEIVRTARRTPVGEPLLIWGEYPDDALHVRSEHELLGALDALHASSLERPRMLRLWSAADDQVVAVLWGERCALYVVESADGYATSTGDASLNESFRVSDHEGHPLTVPLADCVSWDYARRALVRFIEHSDSWRRAGRGSDPEPALDDGGHRSQGRARGPPRRAARARAHQPPPDARRGGGRGRGAGLDRADRGADVAGGGRPRPAA